MGVRMAYFKKESYIPSNPTPFEKPGLTEE